MKVDAIRIIETGYAPAESDAAWMESLLEPFEPMTRGLGSVARLFDLEKAPPEVGAPVSRGPLPTAMHAGLQRMWSYLASAHPDLVRAVLDPVPSVVCWSSHRGMLFPEATLAVVRGFLAGTGFRDSIGVLSADPGGQSLLVTVPYGEEVTIPPRTVGQLTRATAHLCSALRLRRRAAAAGTPEGTDAPDVEAVLDPAGKVHDARGGARGKTARATLTEAVRQVERARGRLRRTDPEEALELWRALFDGRWSVVERTESDGRRFLLARRNEPGSSDPMALTQGERDVLACAARGHSNKYIGYLLGVATSTVSSRLETSMRKLGLHSRREVIQMLGGGVARA